ncbi:MAG: aminoacyl-tRNA hydrolase [Planctomycetota bacterium]|jgi:PTH1 family peptidyl-tRNA hydrolase
MVQTKMVVGLGNPGRGYVDTRHNVGFRVIDLLAEVLKIKVKKKKFGAVFGVGKVEEKKLILLKPWEFMNRSGRAVAKAVRYYKVDLSNLLVITDDMALSPGSLRIRARGSSGGHKGLADIIDELDTESIARLRVGIGQTGDEDAVDFVLDRPTRTEKPLLDDAAARAREAALCWIQYGVEPAMNKFNYRPVTEAQN